MAPRFNPQSPHSLRAQQAWQILIAAAMNRQTLTYLSLSQKMYGRNAAGVLNRVLGHVAYFCEDASLPALTSIVIGKGRGTPGSGIPADISQVDAIRESVYETDWYDIVPPSPSELQASMERRLKS